METGLCSQVITRIESRRLFSLDKHGIKSSLLGTSLLSRLAQLGKLRSCLRLLIWLLIPGFVYGLSNRNWIYLDRLFEYRAALATDTVDVLNYFLEVRSMIDANNGVYTRV